MSKLNALMVYPTNAECNIAFERIVTASTNDSIKSFNKHFLWIETATHKIFFMSAIFPENILKGTFDTIWIDSRIDLDKPVMRDVTLKNILTTRLVNRDTPINSGYSFIVNLI